MAMPQVAKIVAVVVAVVLAVVLARISAQLFALSIVQELAPLAVALVVNMFQEDN